MLLLLSVLALLVTRFVLATACSSLDQLGCTTDCVWIPGSCTPFDENECWESNCRDGCDYKPGSSGSCVNSLAATCKSGVSSNCSDLEDGGKCKLRNGSCVTSTTLNCSGTFEDECPPGCIVDLEFPSCEPKSSEDLGETGQSGESSSACNLSTNTITMCESMGCEWNGNQCSGESEWVNCAEVSGTIVTECDNKEGLCTVKSGCVFNSDGISAMCESVGVDNCDSEAPFCALGSNGNCVIGFTAFCKLHDTSNCVQGSDGLCKVSGEECVFDGNAFCDQFSTLPITECGQQSQSCKISENVCVELSPEEKCAKLDVEKIIPCEKHNECQVVGSECKGKVSGDDSSCNMNSIVPSSECENQMCQISEFGSCVISTPVPPVCELTANKKYCQPSEGCKFRNPKTCKNIDCSDPDLNLGDVESCNGYSVDGTGGICEWNEEVEVCVPESPIDCTADEDGSCTPDSVIAGCTSTSASIESCSIPESVICVSKTTSACSEEKGCKWKSNDGGTCYAKNCSNSPSFEQCCTDDPSNCAYCAGSYKPGCLVDQCKDAPSYSHCCPGTGCASFCAANPDDKKCFCDKNSDDEKCKSDPDPGRGSNIGASFILLVLLILAWL